MVAGLAEACQVRFDERDDPEHAETRVTELVKCLSVLGTIASTRARARRPPSPPMGSPVDLLMSRWRSCRRCCCAGSPATST